MKRVRLAIAVLLSLATSARAQNYAACQINGIITVCPDNVRLKTGKTLIETYIPSLDASKIGSGTFAVARIPTAIPAINIGGGGVDNTEFGYLDGVITNIQTQLNGLQPLDSDLTAIAALSTTGILARVTTNTWTLRTLTAGTGITVTNGDGVSGNPTVALTNSSLTIAAGTGLSVAGCSPVGLGGTCTPSIANTAVSAASYPTSGQIPTFKVNAQGQLTAAGSTTTLTSPAISSPTFSGSYTLGGTPTVPASGLSGTVAKANGGFGQSVATGLTYGQGPYVDSSGVLQIGNEPFDLVFAFYGGTTTNEYAIEAGNATTPLLASITIPVFQASGSGSCFTLYANSDTPSSGTVTYRMRRSSNKGGAWADLSGSSVTCNYGNGTTSCSDTTHTGTFSAGDWVQPTVQWTVSNGLGYFGGIRVRCRFD